MRLHPQWKNVNTKPKAVNRTSRLSVFRLQFLLPRARVSPRMSSAIFLLFATPKEASFSAFFSPSPGFRKQTSVGGHANISTSLAVVSVLAWRWREIGSLIKTRNQGPMTQQTDAQVTDSDPKIILEEAATRKPVSQRDLEWDRSCRNT